MSLTEKVYNKILQARKKPKLIISNTPTGMSLYGIFKIETSTWTMYDYENDKTSSNRNS